MAKKTLINADMLLATPRRTEANTTISQPASEPITPAIEKEPVIEQPTPSPSEPTRIVSEPTPIVQEIISASSVVPDQQISVSSVQKGLKIGETRATFIVQEDALEKIKAIAYWDRKNIKEVMNSALMRYIAEYEAKNGNIQSIP